MIPVSEQIKTLRINSGETQAEAATGVATSPSMFSTWERTDYNEHSLSTLNKIAEHYHQDLLVTFVPKKKRKRK